QEAKATIAAFVKQYNEVRLHSAISYIAPADRLAGHQDHIWSERDRKIEQAREVRAQRRQRARQTA
ncbi:MAG: IS3 family transposase, partial [Myxococcota bacterium]